MNDYTGIAECYDLLMRAGYYDHDAMAKAAQSVIGDRKKILELGVGTGLFAESLIGADVDYEITGVDITTSMLDIARDRIGDQAELVEADVAAMQLDETFDTAISSGGVWVILDDEDDYLLGTHLASYGDDVSGLRNVADHLEPNGLLLLSIQTMHRDLELQLPEGVVYSQRVSEPSDPADHFFVEKEYSFTCGPAELGRETLNLGFYRGDGMDLVFDEAGLAFEYMDDDEKFFVYSKRESLATAGA